MNRPINIFSAGFGKAGNNLHLGVWDRLGAQITAHDTNPARLNPENLPDGAKKMLAASRLVLLEGGPLYLSEAPDVVDVVTSSGHHVDAIEQYLDAADRKDFDAPSAWLLEKPIVSSEKEASKLKALLDAGDLAENGVFVNQTYNASVGAEKMRDIVAQERQNGNPLTSVEVVFYKNRVPDVRAGRFTDPTLGAYGIELPHALDLALTIAGVADHADLSVVENEYRKGIHGVPESEATFVHLTSKDGVDIKMAQGLGPFTMDGSGHMVAHPDSDDNKLGIHRYALARFSDGREAKLSLAPVVGIPNYHTRVEWQDENGGRQELVQDDNTVLRLLGSVATFAQTGDRDAYTRPGMTAHYALDSAAYLDNLRATAREVTV